MKKKTKRDSKLAIVTQEAAKKHAGGRPSKLPKISLKQVKFLYLDGKTDQQVADFLEIDVSTLTRWKQKHEKFCTSLKDWKAEADAKVERSLYERALGFDHPEEQLFQYMGKVIRAKTTKKYPPDPTSIIFWLKNRRPKEWRDKQDVEHSGQIQQIFIPEKDNG